MFIKRLLNPVQLVKQRQRFSMLAALMRYVSFIGSDVCYILKIY